MIWKCIYFCNLPKSVFPTLCQFVPSKVKLSDCQREYSNLLYSAFYPIILYGKNVLYRTCGHNKLCPYGGCLKCLQVNNFYIGLVLFLCHGYDYGFKRRPFSLQDMALCLWKCDLSRCKRIPLANVPEASGIRK